MHQQQLRCSCPLLTPLPALPSQWARGQLTVTVHLLCAKSCARLRDLRSWLPKLCYFFLAAFPAQKQAKCTCEDGREPGAWEPGECSKSATCTCTPVPTGVSQVPPHQEGRMRLPGGFVLQNPQCGFAPGTHSANLSRASVCRPGAGDLSPAPTADWGSPSFSHSLPYSPNESFLNANCKAGVVLVNSAHTAPAIQGGGGGGDS